LNQQKNRVRIKAILYDLSMGKEKLDWKGQTDQREGTGLCESGAPFVKGTEPAKLRRVNTRNRSSARRKSKVKEGSR